jgi:hypothetical protein
VRPGSSWPYSCELNVLPLPLPALEKGCGLGNELYFVVHA